MIRKKFGKTQTNTGIQAERVRADVMAVGAGAIAYKGSPLVSSENTGKSLRILFIASSPQAFPPLDLAKEVSLLENELRGVRFRDKIILEKGHAVRPDDLVQLLRRHQPTVVHFSGHGSDEGIILRADDGELTAPGSVLVNVFRERGVKLVVLNSCFSDSQAIALKDVVGAVVGTAAAIDDEAARRFTATFYRTLGEGHSIKDAFRDAGNAVALVNNLEDAFRAYGNLEESIVGQLNRDSMPLDF